jgi:hypothetical protein
VDGWTVSSGFDLDMSTMIVIALIANPRVEKLAASDSSSQASFHWAISQSGCPLAPHHNGGEKSGILHPAWIVVLYQKQDYHLFGRDERALFSIQVLS